MKEKNGKRVSNVFPNSIPKVGDLVRMRQHNSFFEARVLSRGNENGNFWIQISYYRPVLTTHSITYKPTDLNLEKDGWKLGIGDTICISNRNVEIEVL